MKKYRDMTDKELFNAAVKKYESDGGRLEFKNKNGIDVFIEARREWPGMNVSLAYGDIGVTLGDDKFNWLKIRAMSVPKLKYIIQLIQEQGEEIFSN